MASADEFIEAYKKFEANVRFIYHLKDEESIVTALKKSRQYGKYMDQIQSCANLRNYYQHTAKVNNVFAAEPMEEAITFIQALSEMVLQRKRCRDICIPMRNVFWKTPLDSVKNTMQSMRKNMFTHVPILENGIVEGVFDENSLFTYISENSEDIFELDDKLTFEDIRQHISTNSREMEEFAFVSMNKFVDEVVDMFERQFENNKRLGLIFLTNTGKPTEPLQGILTPWDIIAKS